MGKKDAAEKIGKKERAALEQREQELAAELAKREKKAAKKAARRAEAIAQLEALIGDKNKPKSERKVAKADLAKLLANELEDAAERTPVGQAPATLVDPAAFDAEAAKLAKVIAAGTEAMTSAKTKTAAAAAATLAVAGNEATAAAAHTAAAAADEAEHDETADQIKARVKGKRERRALLESDDYRAGIDRADAEAVKAYNEEAASLGLAHFLTSTDEVNAAVAKLHIVEPVETETGTVYAAGAGAVVDGSLSGDAELLAEDPPVLVPADDFAAPSEAPKVDFEQNGNGQYKVKRPSDGNIVGYTRVTTFIDCLEDKRALHDWTKRLLLEGVAIHDTDGQADDGTEGAIPEPVVSRVRQLVHVRDLAIAKAKKKDKAGKLGVGDLACLTDRAWGDFKKALNALAGELEELGGRSEKANKGTDIHALCELYDREGIDAVGQLLTDGKITPADLVDVEAYAAAMKRAGLKVLDIERVVVNDEDKTAGRLDRIVMGRLPGAQRATRMVGDIKTGRIDFGAGKIAQQLEKYASSTGYDLNTHEREDLKLNRTKGILIHLPAGTGECHIYVVDLGLGRKGNGLAKEVRAWRNEGKRAIDTKVDLAAPVAAEVVEEQAA